MQSPGIRRKQLALSFAASIRVPELCGQEETTKCFHTAGVDL